MEYSSSPYQGQGDAVLELYRRGRPAFDINPYPSPEMLEKAFAATGGEAENFRLWTTAGGELAAFALMDIDFGNLIFETEPEAAGQVLPEIAAWAAGRMRCENQKSGANNPVETLCFTTDPERERLLLANGFERLEGDTVRLLRNLSEPIPEPQFPPGFSVRSSRGEADAERYAALHRAAFATDWMTTERRLDLMREPGYDPDLDLVAVAPDGTWAAYVVGHWDLNLPAPDGGKLGWTDPIGTHPDFRRLGLSRNLIARALQLLKAGGASYAAVGTLSSNTAMMNVLQGIGYCEIQRFYWFSLKV
jgi:GNAT superfamily N-acetyltransferase